jgi:outer membrane protein
MRAWRGTFLLLISAAAWTTALADADAPVTVVRLDEARAVELALENTLAIKLSLLRRDTDRFTYRVARQQFVPRVGFFTSAGRRQIERRPEDAPLEQDEIETLDVGPSASWRLPTGGQFSYDWSNRFTVRETTLGHAGTGIDPAWDLGWTLTFAQPLLRGAGLRVGMANYEQARFADQLSQLTLRSAVGSAIDEVLTSLRRYLQARETQAIVERSVQRARELLDISRDLETTGRISRSQVTQAESDLAARELSLLGATNAADSARLRLARLLNFPAGTQFEVSVPETIEPVRADLADALEIAWRERPDWAASLVAQEAALLGLDVARNAQLWDLRLTASHGRASIDRDTASFPRAYGGLARPDREENFVGLVLDVPVWDGYSRRASLVAARNNLRQRDLTHAELRLAIESEVIDQHRNLEYAWRALELARSARNLAHRALDDESVRLASGLTSTLNLTRLQDALVAAQSSELGAVIGYLNAVTAFDRALGTTLVSWRIELDLERGTPPTLRP